MKLLWLLKRRYNAKDLFSDRFGRYFHLPTELAKQGIRSRAVLLSYRLSGRETREEGGVFWETVGFSGYPSAVRRAVRRFEPDAVIAGHDTIYGILGRPLARVLEKPFFMDLSDNYESFASARIPGVKRLFHRALDRASLVTCVSPALAEKLRREHPWVRSEVLENGVDSALFHPLEKTGCRKRWEVEGAEVVFGYAGALHPNRGIETLFGAWEEVSRARPGARLLLAGPKYRGVKVPPLAGMRELGPLSQAQIPSLLGACDEAIVLSLPGPFGSYACPQKEVEARAVGTRVLAASDRQTLVSKMLSAVRSEGGTEPVTHWADLAVRYGAWLRRGLS